jgi:hypothetical protein
MIFDRSIKGGRNHDKTHRTAISARLSRKRVITFPTSTLSLNLFIVLSYSPSSSLLRSLSWQSHHDASRLRRKKKDCYAEQLHQKLAEFVVGHFLAYKSIFHSSLHQRGCYATISQYMGQFWIRLQASAEVYRRCFPKPLKPAR